MTKVTAISKDKKFFKIGETLADAVWYGYSSELEDTMKTITKGDTVEFKYEVGADTKRVLSSIKKLASDTPPPTPEGVTGTPATTYKKPWVEYGGKSPEVQDSIRKQAVGHMTSRTLIALQGQITLENVLETIDKLYAHYLNLTK